MSTFADRLRRAREAKGITLYRLAQLTGISRQGVINLELPGADPKLSTVAKVATALGVSVVELVADHGQPKLTAAPVPARSSDAASPIPVWPAPTGMMIIALLDELREAATRSRLAQQTSLSVEVASQMRRVLSGRPRECDRRKLRTSHPDLAPEQAQLYENAKLFLTQLEKIGNRRHANGALPPDDRSLMGELERKLRALLTGADAD